jgi:anti-sigma factor RsiW
VSGPEHPADSRAASPPIGEEELHAYVDGQLPPERLDAVTRHLQAHPEAADRVAAFAAQRGMLRAALAPIAAEPVPPQLALQTLVVQRLAARRTVWRVAAAVVLAFGLGGAGGWLLRGPFGGGPPNEITQLAREAIANHVVYTADRRRPTELGAEQREDLARWVSNRLNHRVAPPDMSGSGFHYMGGRLAATPQGPAGLFMYQNADSVRLTVFVLPMPHATDHGPRDVDVGRMAGCAWIDKGVGYTVVAPVSTDELHRLTEAVRRQLDAAT